MESPRCGNCVYWMESEHQPEAVPEGDLVGCCRRHPPQVVFSPTPEPGAPEGILKSLFPPMMGKGWCGDWEGRH